LEDGAPVRIGSRALEILIALAEKNGELVTNNALIAGLADDCRRGREPEGSDERAAPRTA
jgi:hypothetical protein